MRGWFESTFGAGALAAQFVVALIVVIVLFGIIAAFARRRNKNAGPAQARGRQPRLAVMDMADVDDRRKLLLIRRDNVEHLVMIGGPSDLVIESAIVRNRPAPQASASHAAERAPDRAAAGLAMLANSRAQVRAPSVSPVGSEAASEDEPRPRSGNGSGGGSGEARTAPPLRNPQFVNPYKPPEVAREEKAPSPAAAPAEPAQTPSPASSPAAVAGLAAGAAALTAAAAKVKRRELSPEPETPPEKPAKAPPVLPVGFNGSVDLNTSSSDIAPGAGPETAPEAAPDTATPEPAEQPEPVVSEDTAKTAEEPETAKASEIAAKPVIAPVAIADAMNEEPPATEAEAGADTGATAESEQKAADETVVAESVATAELAQTESAEIAGKTSPDKSPGEIQPGDAAAVDAADEASFGDNLEAELAEALASPEDQSGEVADTSNASADPMPAEPFNAAPDLTGTTSDATAETATEKPSETARGLTPARSFEEVMAEHIRGGDPDIVTPPQTDVPASPEPEAVPAPSGDAGADTAVKAAEPAAERSAAISPFPTIPEDIRRSVLEAARQAERSPDAGPGMADGGVKTTLGDLAERLEQALAEQASTLSGQLKSDTDAKPAPGPAQSPNASIEEWERGGSASSGAEAPDSTPEAAPSADADPEAAPDAAPRQSQAMLEDETDSGVIDFSDRKKAAPENKSSDSLEDEMARLLGELTGRNSGR